MLEGLDFHGELAPADKAFLERFSEAKALNLNCCNLRSIKHLPVIPGLERLALADNNLTGEDLHVIPSAYKRLKHLDLSNNAIRSLDCVALLSKAQSLRTLDLSANPITEINNYRQNLFEKVPHLEALDGFDVAGSECSFDSSENLRVVTDDDEHADSGDFIQIAARQLLKVGVSIGSSDDEDALSEVENGANGVAASQKIAASFDEGPEATDRNDWVGDGKPEKRQKIN